MCLGNAVVVGAHRAHRGRQTLLRWSRGGGQSHHFSLATKLSVLLQKYLVSGYEIGDLEGKKETCEFDLELHSEDIEDV